MTNRSQARRDDEGAPGRRRGGPAGARPMIAPLVSVIGLAVAAVVSLNLLSFGAIGGGGPGPVDPNESLAPGATRRPDGPLPQRTPDPSVVITPPPDERIEVRGTILFARTGNIWAASGLELKQLSNKGTDSNPVWSPDGRLIYFIETRSKVSDVPYQGRESTYTLEYPVIMSMAPDGSDRRAVQTSLFRLGGGAQWFYWLLQPDVSPDGRTFAVVSDAPDAIGDITLSVVPTRGGRIQNLNVRAVRGLGHNDPAWSPDGTRVAYTHNAREGALGTPRIGIYTVATKRTRLLPGSGYASPSWSPDGRHLVVERTSTRGRDIVILDVETGAELARLTNDGRSFAPAFSPDGTQIAYLRLRGVGVDLRIMTLQITDHVSLLDDKAITEDGSLAVGSPPSWYMPPELRQSPTPGSSPTTSPGASPAP